MAIGLGKYKKVHYQDKKSKDSQEKLKYYLEIFCNDLKTGARLGKAAHTLCNIAPSNEPLEIQGVSLRSDKSAIITCLYQNAYSQKDKQFTNKNMIILFEVPDKSPN